MYLVIGSNALYLPYYVRRTFALRVSPRYGNIVPLGSPQGAILTQHLFFSEIPFLRVRIGLSTVRFSTVLNEVKVKRLLKPPVNRVSVGS